MNPRLRSSLLALVVLALGMAAFAGYTRPGFIVALANQIWLCF